MVAVLWRYRYCTGCEYRQKRHNGYTSLTTILTHQRTRATARRPNQRPTQRTERPQGPGADRSPRPIPISEEATPCEPDLKPDPAASRSTEGSRTHETDTRTAQTLHKPPQNQPRCSLAGDWGVPILFGQGGSYRIRILMYLDVSCMYLDCILMCPVHILNHIHQDTSRYIKIHLYMYLSLWPT
jgi:hypothetical protein